MKARSLKARNLARNVEKQLNEEKKLQWASEKPKLDNATHLRGMYFIIPEDLEFKETMKKRAKHWTRRWNQPFLVRFRTLGTGEVRGENKPNTRRSTDDGVHASSKLTNL